MEFITLWTRHGDLFEELIHPLILIVVIRKKSDVVKGRIKYKAEKSYEAVSPMPVDMSGNEQTGKKALY